MAELSVHCIDVTRAVPADGMRVVIRRVDGDISILSDGPLNAFGALSPPLENVACGTYEATFYIGDFYRAQGLALPTPAFLEKAPFRFGIADGAAHYHLPLKFTPWGFSLFRGG